ncbi:MAG: hypothetical protein WA628_20745 [Terriglobales bacterium]
MESAKANPAVPGVPSLPMNSIWRTIRGYILWSYERGSLHYDVMVTLILVFVFLSPYWINFKDKPIERVPHQTAVVIQPDGQGGFVYQIDASVLSAKDDVSLREQMLGIIEPITGAALISKYEPVKDGSGNVQSYKVWVEKE